jgi:heptosyltransferase-2
MRRYLVAAPDLHSTARRPRLLVLEFWGLGDLTFATPFLRAARERYDITLVGKEHAVQLLQPSFPDIRFLSFDAPWSAYRGKYALWRWNWAEILVLFSRLRAGRFEAAVSVRNDPRDHLFMLLAGARRRYGFPTRGSERFLTDPVTRRTARQHKVEDWWTIGRALSLAGNRHHVRPILGEKTHPLPAPGRAHSRASLARVLFCPCPGKAARAV